MEELMKRKLQILVLEDIPTDAALMEQELKNSNLAFDSKRVDCKEAFLKVIKSYQPDIILSDYSLPQFDGMGALKIARDNIPNVPFIIVTGAINEETAVECMKAGAADYVLKDRLSRLVPAIEGALGKYQAMEEKKTAEEALVASEMRYRRLFESAKEGIILIDANTNKITDVNPYLLCLMSCKKKDVIGNEISNVRIQKKDGSIDALFKDLMEDGYIYCEDIYLELEGKSRIDLELTCSMYSIDSENLIQCNIRDITERKQGEEEKEKIRAQLFQAQKMEAMILIT